MRVLEISELYSERGGGVRTYVAQKFAAAKRLGVDLVVVAPGAEDHVEQRDGGRLIWVKSPVIPVDRRYHVFWSQAPIDAIVEQERPDFIEGSSAWRGGWIAARQARSISKALVFHQDPVLSYPHAALHGWLPSNQIDRSFSWFFRYLVRLQSHFDTSVVSSPWLAERLARQGLRRPTVATFGVDRDFFGGAVKSETIRQDMRTAGGVEQSDAPVFLTVGRFHPEKRIGLLLDAFAAASKSAPMALYVIGDGPTRKAITAKAAKIPGVHLAGPIWARDRLAALYASADAYVHACPNETFGMTIGEAMAAGAPIIAPRAGGAGDLVREPFGELFQADSREGLAEALLSFCRRDPVWRAGASCLARAAAPSAADHFEKLFSLYDRILSRRRRPFSTERPAAANVGGVLETAA